jgi:hypothetical protein
MKKFFVLPLIMFLIAGVCFAQSNEQAYEPPEIERFDLEIYSGFPIHWTNAKHGQDFFWFNPNYTMEDKSVTANNAIGVSMNFNFNKDIGLNIDADFFFGAKLAGFSNPSSDYISLVGGNALIGPVFYLFNNDLLRIPLTVGAHMYFFGDDFWMPNLFGYDPQNPSGTSTEGAWVNRRDFQLGPGVSLGVQFHFNNNIYIFSRTNVVLDLFRWHSISYIADDGTGTGTLTDQYKSETEFVLGWGVKPVIGIGIKY